MASRFVISRDRQTFAGFGVESIRLICPVNGSIKRLIISELNDNVTAGVWSRFIVQFPADAVVGAGRNVLIVPLHVENNLNVLNEELNIPCDKGQVLEIQCIPAVATYPMAMYYTVIWELEREGRILAGESAA